MRRRITELVNSVLSEEAGAGDLICCNGKHLTSVDVLPLFNC